MLVESPEKQVPLFTAITEAEKAQGYLSRFTSPLLHLTPTHTLTLEQSFEGFQIFGGVGSGKTSGSGRTLAHALLHAGYGGIVFCAKPDEAQNWIDYATACGREKSVLRFAEDTNLRFNFLQYELTKGASPFDVAEIIDNARRAANPAATMTSDGQTAEFWNDAARDLLVASMVILFGSTGGCKLDELSTLIATAPQSTDQMNDKEGWQDSSPFFQHVLKTASLGGRHVSMADFRKATDYFRQQFAPMQHKMRSSIVQTLMTSLNRFNYGMLSELFTKGTNVVPEMVHGGAILIIDIHAMKGTDARVGAQIWKYSFQRATTRQADQHTRPVFIWADESQYFINEKDVEFQSTARSSRVTTVYMTQSLPAYKHAIGGTDRANTAARAFIANLRTQIFHSNNDPETNQYGADLIGKTVIWRKNLSRGESDSRGTTRSWSDAMSEATAKGTTWTQSDSHSTSTSESKGDGRQFFGASWLIQTLSKNTSTSDSTSLTRGTAEGGTKSDTESFSQTLGEGTTLQRGITQQQGMQEHKDYRVDPDEFAHTLRTGGYDNQFKVDAIVVSPLFSDPSIKVTFDQRI